MERISKGRASSQWDETSTDSGFSSDLDRNQRLLDRRHKTKSLCRCEASKPAEDETEINNTDSSRSLPSCFRIAEQLNINWSEVGLNDFDHVRNLGGGGYARVDLIQLNRHGRRDRFALKKISKKLVVEANQERQFEAEKEVLLMARSRFIPRLFKTFVSPNHVYLLTEACLHGDLFSYLEKSGPVQCKVARFAVACVVEALEYLHRILHVIHRDVKTENLLIGDRGLLKLADLGFCKTVDSTHSQTYTFCGTPGYIAPEVILHTGHDYSADYFSLGVVTYELLTCRSPFRRHAMIDTYKATLRGISDVAFPSQIDHKTRTFVRALCSREAERRLSSEDNSKHVSTPTARELIVANLYNLARNPWQGTLTRPHLRIGGVELRIFLFRKSLSGPR